MADEPRGDGPARQNHEQSRSAPEQGRTKPPETKGYGAENPTPLNAEDLTPPKGDTAVQPPERAPTEN